MHDKPDNIYEYSPPIKVDVDKFLSLFDIILNLNDDSILTGFLYNIGPYITCNYQNFTEQDKIMLWNGFLKYFDRIEEYPAIYGYIEAITQACLYGIFPPQSFIEYLQTNLSPNDTIKPFVLISLYSELPHEFFDDCTKEFIPVLNQTFITADSSYIAYQLIFLEKIIETEEHVQLIDISDIWKGVYQFTKDHPDNYLSIMNPLHKLKRKIGVLFETVDAFIESKISELADETISVEKKLELLIPLIRLIPFVSPKDLETLLIYSMVIISYYLSSHDNIPNKLHDAFDDALMASHSREVFTDILMTCQKALNSEYYPAAIVILAKFHEGIERFNPQEMVIFDAIIDGIKSEYPIKPPLFHSLLEFIPDFNNFSKEGQEKMIVFLMNCVSTLDPIMIKYGFKVLRYFLSNNVIEPFPDLSYFVQFYGRLPPETNYYLLKLINIYIQQKDQDQTSIKSILQAIVDNEDSSIRDKMEAVEIFRIVSKNNTEVFTAFKENMILIIKVLLESDQSKSYVKAIRLICMMIKKDNAFDIAQYKDRIIGIVRGNVQSNPNVRRDVAFYLLRIKNIPYPTDVIEMFLNNEDPLYHVSASEILINLNDVGLFKQFLLKLYSLAKVSTSFVFVNDVFHIASKIIKADKKSNEIIDNFLWLALLGRLAIYNHMRPYSYNKQNFRLYSLIKRFIQVIPAQSSYIVDILVRWMPHLSNYIVPNLIPLFDISLNSKLISPVIGKELLFYLSNQVKENVHHEKICKAVLPFMLKTYHTFADHFIILPFVKLLEEIWMSNHDHVCFETMLIPLFLQVFADPSFSEEGNFTVFKQISESIYDEVCNLDYQRICSYYIEMHDHNVPFYTFNDDAAKIFANFLIKDSDEIQQFNFTSDVLQNMHRCLKQILKKDPLVRKHLKKFFENDPEALDRIRKLSRSPTLPTFKAVC